MVRYPPEEGSYNRSPLPIDYLLGKILGPQNIKKQKERENKRGKKEEKRGSQSDLVFGRVITCKKKGVPSKKLLTSVGKRPRSQSS